MKLIDIQSTEKTPGIILDNEKHCFEISGCSYPNNIREFSHPVIKALKKYLNELDPNTRFRLNFKLGYFNSATAKMIGDIFMLINGCISNGYHIEVYWYYPEDDEDMLEAGQEFSQMLNMAFNYVMIAQPQD